MTRSRKTTLIVTVCGVQLDVGVELIGNGHVGLCLCHVSRVYSEDVVNVSAPKQGLWEVLGGFSELCFPVCHKDVSDRWCPGFAHGNPLCLYVFVFVHSEDVGGHLYV